MGYVLLRGTQAIDSHYKTMPKYTKAGLAIPETVYYITSGSLLLFCDLIKRIPFGIRISKYLTWEKRQEGRHYHESLDEHNLKERW